MAFSADIEHFIKDFVNDLVENNVAIFAGAGMSKSAGYVDWPSLLSDIADELGLKVDREHDLISLAQYHANDRGNTAGIVKKILQEFSEAAELTDNHKILASMPISTYWTTNYDSLIEDALKAAFKVVDVKHEVNQLANTRPKRDAVVYKMHGDVQHASDAVLTKHQYENYFRSHEAFITALSGDLVSKTFLFIGFSFTDPNLDYVLSRLNARTGNNLRQHYCFMKKESKSKDDDNEILKYKQRKQQLRVDDLKRYRIKALLLDEYSDIQLVLKEIEIRFKKRTIFISGSAEIYGEWDRSQAQTFIHNLSKSIIKSNFRIVNGFGWGVGSAVINGALEAIYESPEKFSEEQLVIRPFPQFETNGKKLPELWEEYRQRMISLAGISIFIFGNKNHEGKIINANGVRREFEIAFENGLVLIPVATTGYMSKEIYEEVINNAEKYYSKAPWIIQSLKAMSEPGIESEKIISIVMSVIKKLNS